MTSDSEQRKSVLNFEGRTLEETLEHVGENLGFFQRLGRDHMVVLAEADDIAPQERSYLLVTFCEGGEDDVSLADVCPLGHHLAVEHNWSHMCILSNGETWFRDRAVYGFFDRMVDEALFEDFDKVIFAGGGRMGGYAAAAYSVAAPGADVVIFNPRATLEPRFAGWDGRHRDKRRLDFTSRFGFAPDMIDAAEAVYVVYDPMEREDAMHAALFRGPHVEHLPVPLQGSDTMFEMVTIGLMSDMLLAVANGRFDRVTFYRWLRKRRHVRRYLRRLLAETERRERPYLTALAARTMLSYINGGRIKNSYNRALTQLAEEGRDLPEPKVRVLQSA